MNNRKSIKRGSRLGLNLLRHLAKEGYRIFRIEQVRELAEEYGLSEGYIPVVLHHLKKDGWVISLQRGVYALGPALIGGSPLHEFEIAMHLVLPSAISHWSAFHYHDLTDQVPHIIYVLTPSRSIPRSKKKHGHRLFVIERIPFQFIQVKPSRYFGIELIWVGDAKVSITDLERSLLDGLMKPKYCGGFGEVMHAFQLASDRVNIKKIIEYSLRLDVAISKRLGWILSKQGVSMDLLSPLKDLPMKGYRRLDVGSPAGGSCDSTWGIQVNDERRNS